MTTRELLQQAADRVAETNADATAWDARLLLGHAMGGAPPLALDPRLDVFQGGDVACIACGPASSDQ